MHLLAIVPVAEVIPARDLHLVATVMQIAIFMVTVALISIPAAVHKVTLLQCICDTE